MPQLAYVLLPVALVLLALHTRKDIAEYQAFKKLTATEDRQRSYRKWVIASFLIFGCGSIVGLALIGHLRDVLAPIGALTAAMPDVDGGGGSSMTGAIGMGTGIGIAIGVGLAIRRWRKRPGEASALKVIGDIEALLPRNAAERGWCALLSLNAGLSEELFFRLLLPALVYIVTGNAVVALAAPVLVFGLVHVYQGWKGVLATTFLGALFTMVYLMSGSIFVAMALHAAIDLNTLVLLSALRQRQAGSRARQQPGAGA